MAHDLRFALRAIFSHRWFSAAVVATLALGIGLNTMVFTLINAVLFKPVPVPGGARLVSIVSRNVAMSDRYLPMSYPDFQNFRAWKHRHTAPIFMKCRRTGRGVYLLL
jgi:hypothetical protein